MAKSSIKGPIIAWPPLHQSNFSTEVIIEDKMIPKMVEVATTFVDQEIFLTSTEEEEARFWQGGWCFGVNLDEPVKKVLEVLHPEMTM